MRLLVVCALLASTGCGAGAMAVLSGLAQGAQWLGSLIDAGEAGANAYLARHPGQAPAGEVETAVSRARLGVAALDRAIAAGLRLGDQEYDAARHEALSAYDALWKLLHSLGVITGRAPLGGVETEAPLPDPVPLPPMEEVASRL